MVLIYKFKKEKLENGEIVSRPRILVELAGNLSSITIPALIDTGCDTTVIPESIANIIGLNKEGKKDKLYAFRESNEVIYSTAKIMFLGKQQRQSIILNKIPVLIALEKEGIKDESDIIIGLDGVFDSFEITFKKFQNKIIFKEANNKFLFTKK